MSNLCIKVKNKEAQRVKTLLLENGLIDTDRKPAHQKGHVIFPIKHAKDKKLKEMLGDVFELTTHECQINDKRRKGNLASLLKGTIPGELMDLVPKSFNIIGNIIILELRDELNSFKKEIAEKLVLLHPNCKNIYNKTSEREGDFRTRGFELIWGDDNPVTVHVENGCKFEVDIEKVFFDPRLSNEHGRVVSLASSMVEDKDINILDLFCGVGPFTIPLARNPRARVWAVDLNPEAIRYLIQNISLNKVEKDKINTYIMDANEFASPGFKQDAGYPAFNVVLLNLPRKAHEFLDPAHSLVAAGGIIHWYTVAPEFIEKKTVEGGDPRAIMHTLRSLKSLTTENPVDDICIEGLQVAMDRGLIIKRITRIKPYSPYRFIFCFDLEKSTE